MLHVHPLRNLRLRNCLIYASVELRLLYLVNWRLSCNHHPLELDRRLLALVRSCCHFFGWMSPWTTLNWTVVMTNAFDPLSYIAYFRWIVYFSIADALRIGVGCGSSSLYQEIDNRTRKFHLRSLKHHTLLWLYEIAFSPKIQCTLTQVFLFITNNSPWNNLDFLALIKDMGILALFWGVFFLCFFIGVKGFTSAASGTVLVTKGEYLRCINLVPVILILLLQFLGKFYPLLIDKTILPIHLRRYSTTRIWF